MRHASLIIVFLSVALMLAAGPAPAQTPPCFDYGTIADPVLGTVGLQSGMMVVDGDLAYVVDSVNGLLIISLADPLAPVLIGSQDTPGISSDVAVAGGIACVVDQGSTVHLIDVSDPTAPVLRASITQLDAQAVWTDGVVMYVAMGGGVTMHAIVNPAAPVDLGLFPLGEAAASLAKAGSLLLAGGTSRIHVLDATMPFSLTELGTIPTEYAATLIAPDLPRVRYVDARGLFTADLGVPSAPVVVDTLDFSDFPRALFDDGNGRMYVACGLGGLRAFDVSDPWHPAFLGGQIDNNGPVGVTLQGTTLVTCAYNQWKALDPDLLANDSALGRVDLPDQANAVAVEGDIACVAASYAGLFVYDVSDPAAPQLLAVDDGCRFAEKVEMQNGLAYVADWAGGLRIVDLNDPANPVVVGIADGDGYVYDVAVDGNCAFARVYSLGLARYDVSDPSAPVLVGSASDVGGTIGMDTQDGWLYAAAGNGGLCIYDGTGATGLTFAAQLATPHPAYDVVVDGGHAYLGIMSSLGLADVSDPANPVFVSEYATPQREKALALQGSMLYIVDDRGAILPVDVSDPLAPRALGTAISNGSPKSAVATADLVFVASGIGGLEIFPAACPGVSGVEMPAAPAGNVLLAARPNPFNPATVIPYALDRAQSVRITVHDVRGRLVAELLAGERAAGPGTVRWDGRDRHGRSAPAGVYFARMVTASGEASTRMVLLK